MRAPVGNLVVPGLPFIGLQSAAPEQPVPVPEISSAEAWDRILALSEIRQLAVWLPLASAGEVGLTVLDDGNAAPGYWTFYIGEDHPTHTVRTWTMRVSSFTGEITKWDSARDEFIEIDRWRKQGAREGPRSVPALSLGPGQVRSTEDLGTATGR
jgi:hypothetical protein